jgi:hypothetical protein
MKNHQLYLSLGDNRWVIAWCGCDGWRQELMPDLGQPVSEVVKELEKEFQEHAGLDTSVPYTPALPTG